MIAKLTGRLDGTGPGWAVVDVGGVGYLVFAAGRTLRRLGPAGAAVALLIDTHVREDHIHLYGFADEGERAWFRLLITVQGVGAKVALAVLDALGAEGVAAAVAAGDRAALARADGVGPKLATRIATELKDKGLAAAFPSETAPGVPPAAAGPKPAAGPPDTAADAVSALVNLGYARTDAFGAVTAVIRRLGPGAALPEVIRQGLRELSPVEPRP